MRIVLLAIVLGLIASASAQYNANRDANQAAHKTNKYRGDDGKPQTTYVILRRHQPFTINVDPAYIDASSEFNLVPEGLYRDKAVQKLDVGSRDAAGKKVTLTNPGAIGIYTLQMKAKGATFTAPEKFIFVFNPYVAADDAYIPPGQSGQSAPDLAEHIENEYGAVWLSDPTGNSWKSWIYNQFDLSALLTSQELLGELTTAQRTQVYLVARWLSRRTSDVLRGRWDGQYSDGKQPGFWSTSTEIITEYRKNKATVKYGQCWVFASLLTTLSRTLGFASLPMTNINSAHEKPVGGKFKCECIMNYNQVASGYEAGSGSTCSIWNFHVWNHGWFKRPDLLKAGAKPTDLWNAYDATPQEESQGPESNFGRAYYCGPASISVMKSFKGCEPSNPKFLDSDAQFIRSESNAVVTFQVKKQGGSTYEKLRTDPSHVGEAMWYKVADSQCRGAQPVNGGYNRLCKGNAARMYSEAGSFLETETGEPLFRADYSGVGKDQYNDAGKAFKGKIFTQADKLTAAGVKKVDYFISLSSVDNKGKVAKVLKQVSGVFDPTKPVSRENVMELQVGSKDWATKDFLDALKLSSTLQFAFFAFPDKGAAFGSQSMVRLNPGAVQLQCGARTQGAGELSCKVIVTNTMPVKLTGVKVKLVASGQGVQAEQSQASKLATAPDVAAGADRHIDGGASSTQSSGSQTGVAQQRFREKLMNRNPVAADDVSGRKTTELGSFKVKATRLGKTLISGTVLSNELPPLVGEYEITIQ